MHMQLAVLFFLAIIALVATGINGAASCKPCRQYLGVYYYTITRATLTFNEVHTYHPDQTFNTIISIADGDFSITPPVPPNSVLNGVWNCNGTSAIQANAIKFYYLTNTTQRSAGLAVYDLQFTQNFRASGSLTINRYTLPSTSNQDLSQWNKTAGPILYSVTGYKLYM